ncbi:hypothetical protein MPSEU_000822000 [Mayamaea pseudoterrestris]|nr:hypothetical protein MPSEU_000822000 [Mayamaea pseudoterrestris]
MWPSSTRTLSTRIVSYNVLSSHLAQPSHYSTYPVEHLDASNRLAIVLQKLQTELDANKRVIFCLQEVSHDWAGALHTFFSNRNYYMVTGNYGKAFNGYMGVCMAWPTKELETVDVSMARLSDQRVDGWPPADQVGACMNVVKSIQKIYYRLTKTWPKAEPWADAERRNNIILTATLRDRETRKSFLVATYHMPCAFYAPPIMTIHSEMAAQYTQRIAAEQGDVPYVLAGDFNIKPGDAPYKLLLTADASVSMDEASIPPTRNGFAWKSAPLAPMRSAYAECLQTEPDFTNFARTGDKEPFIDTLDYIFISKEWKVDDVLKLPHRDVAKGPFPNLDANEPSDHVLIAADLSLKSS